MVSYDPSQDLMADHVNYEKSKQLRRLLYLGKGPWVAVIIIWEIRPLDGCQYMNARIDLWKIFSYQCEQLFWRIFPWPVRQLLLKFLSFNVLAIFLFDSVLRT